MTLAVLCPGQGAQHTGMLRVGEMAPEGRAAIAAAEAALGVDLRAVLAARDRMFANTVAQPLLCTAQLATWSALRDGLPRPTAVAGYSVGELAAYGVGGALEAAELAMLARERATIMDAAAAACEGHLIAQRGLRRDSVDALCDGRQAWVAIVTGDDACVIGGTRDALAVLERDLVRSGAQVTSLRVGVASHTPLMRNAVEPFRHALDASSLRAPAFTVIAGIDASPVSSKERAIATLAVALASAIEWAQCLDALFERGCRVFLELGPGRALSKMALERFDAVEARSVEEFGDPATIAGWVRRSLSAA